MSDLHIWQENLFAAEQMAQEQKEKLLKDYKVSLSNDSFDQSNSVVLAGVKRTVYHLV